MATPLIFIPSINAHASARLICFPYAGGNSATYLSWQNYIDSDVELAVVQLPGRGIRLSDTPYQTMSEIVTALFSAIERLSDKPFIFYGHSMGACVAYELTLMLHRFHRRLPIHFIASGSTAPSIKRSAEKTHNLADEEFIVKLGELNSPYPEVLNNHEVMQLILPALRADFKIIESYCSKNKVKIPTRLSVLVGDEENVEISDVEAWFTLFMSPVDMHWIPGGHFFIDTNKIEVLKVVNAVLKKYLPRSSFYKEI